MTLLDLAARCESATGPSFVLERDISEALGVPLTRPYTASIDAALMLAPEGREWSVELWDSNGVYPPHVRACAWVCGARRGHAATPALALCAAALRARAQTEGQEA